MNKSNFVEKGEDAFQATIRLEVSIGDAKIMMKNKIKNYAQWFPGRMNNVSGTISREDNRSDEELINIFLTFTPSQIPDHFKIVPLPREISSLLTSLLQRLPLKEQLRERHTRTNLGCGKDVKNTVDQSELLRMSS